MTLVDGFWIEVFVLRRQDVPPFALCGGGDSDQPVIYVLDFLF